jgi:hypothetical protein
MLPETDLVLLCRSAESISKAEAEQLEHGLIAEPGKLIPLLQLLGASSGESRYAFALALAERHPEIWVLGYSSIPIGSLAYAKASRLWLERANVSDSARVRFNAWRFFSVQDRRFALCLATETLLREGVRSSVEAKRFFEECEVAFAAEGDPKWHRASCAAWLVARATQNLDAAALSEPEVWRMVDRLQSSSRRWLNRGDFIREGENGGAEAVLSFARAGLAGLGEAWNEPRLSGSGAREYAG